MSAVPKPGLLNRLNRGMEWLTQRFIAWVGSAPAFVVAATVIVVWALTGPMFDYSDTWQLVINTGTSVVTFLMVFLIQRSQNKDTLALQLKLNEVVAALKGASNRLINVENLSEDEVRELSERYQRLADAAQGDDRRIGASCSVEGVSCEPRDEKVKGPLMRL